MYYTCELFSANQIARRFRLDTVRLKPIKIRIGSKEIMSDQEEGKRSEAEKQTLCPQVLGGEGEREEEITNGALEYELAIEKTESGFGIYFAKLTGEPSDPNDKNDKTADRLVVDGFVDNEEHGSDSEDVNSEANRSMCDSLRALKLGDVLIGINSVDCQGKAIMDVVGLLRSAEMGSNTLRFLRPQEPSEESDEDEFPAEDGHKKLSVKGSFMGALLKVTSKIKAEIGDEEAAQRVEEENELFQKQWLEEFDRFKAEYETKWETCTYEADEFCGLIYHSADDQMKQYLQREYPTLIEAWEDDLTGRSLRASWPAARSVFVDPVVVEFHPLARPLKGGQKQPQLHEVQCSPALQSALDSLRTEFMWRHVHVEAFVQRLAANGIACCSDLISALTAKGGRQFMQQFQSLQYPRLTPTICRALLQSTQELFSQQEQLEGSALVTTLKVTHTHGPVTSAR